MISICIPVYNTDVTKLSQELNRQIMLLTEEVCVEIIIGDDCSKTDYHNQYHSISDLKHLSVLKAETNLGRSKIRNWIALHARYDYLLFIDGDCLIDNEHYVENYIEAAKKGFEVCIGGIAYEKILSNPDYLLRWKYGIKREAILNFENSELSFLSSNFLIKKTVFNRFPFNESFEQYGHEDTLLGIELRKAGIGIKQIENPVIHNGLEKAETFLNKVYKSIENTNLLIAPIKQSNIKNPGIIIQLMTMPFPAWFLALTNAIYKICTPVITKNLRGKHPSLFLFDIQKLLYTFHVKHTKLQ